MKTNLRRRKTLHGLAAFTLVEVTVAAAVLTIAFSSIFGIMTLGLFVSQTSRENLRATQILMDKMEGVRLFGPTQITNTALLTRSFTNWFYETNNIGLVNAQGYGIQYTGSISIAPVSFVTSYSSNMQQVIVNIGWISGERGAIAHTRSMSTLYANQGLYNYVWTSK